MRAIFVCLFAGITGTNGRLYTLVALIIKILIIVYYSYSHRSGSLSLPYICLDGIAYQRYWNPATSPFAVAEKSCTDVEFSILSKESE